MPHIEISGIVSQRDQKPYVQMLLDGKPVSQLSIAEARSIAMDLFRAASYAEADAMLVTFFGKMEFPNGALNALLLEFRTFRYELDTAHVETVHTPPDDQKGPSNA